VSEHAFVWLASQSPRRQQLLDQIGVAHRPLLPGPEEDAEALEHERPGELPKAYVERVTRAKLHAARERLARRRLDPAPILCADTTVAAGRRILGKPADAADAARMLRLLSGRTHRVLTSVGVHDGVRMRFATNVSHVRVRTLSEAEIAAYIASREPFGKAGAYAIQGGFAVFVREVRGSHSAIMGLPLFEAADLLRRAHVRIGATA
jgi:septum formation protein